MINFTEMVINGTIKTARRIAEAVTIDVEVDGWQTVNSNYGIRNPSGCHSDCWVIKECVEFNNALKAGLKDKIVGQISNSVLRINANDKLSFIDDRIRMVNAFHSGEFEGGIIELDE